MTDAINTASSQVFQAPTSANPTDADINAAVANLSKTGLDRLWEEKVTNVGWRGKLVGVLTYLWNRSKTVAANKECDKIIQEFNKASVELVRAVAERTLYSGEAAARGYYPVVFNDANLQQQYAGELERTEKAVSEFYRLFGKRVKKLGIGNNKYVTYSFAAEKIIRTAAKSLKHIPDPNTLNLKIGTTLHQFKNLEYNGLLGSYASQEISKITPKGFEQRTALIGKLFSGAPANKIKDDLVQEIQKHHNADKIRAIRDEYRSNASRLGSEDLSARVKDIKTQVGKEYSDEITQLDTELKGIIGEDLKGGPECKVVKAKQAADEGVLALQKAKEALLKVFEEGTDYVDAVDTNKSANDSLPKFDASSVPQLQLAFTQAKKDLEEKKKDFEKLCARANEIATVNKEGTVTGGRLYDLRQQLAKVVESGTREEINRIVDFYTLLLNFKKTVEANTKPKTVEANTEETDDDEEELEVEANTEQTDNEKELEVEANTEQTDNEKDLVTNAKEAIDKAEKVVKPKTKTTLILPYTTQSRNYHLHGRQPLNNVRNGRAHPKKVQVKVV